MPNREIDNRYEAMLAMLNDRGIEVHANADLGELIRAELSKNETDIDAAYVDELVQLEQELSAVVSQDHRKARRRGHRHRNLSRLSIALVCCLVLSIGSMGIASAFNWARLIRILRPIMQTLGIHMNVDDEHNSEEYERGMLSETPDVDVDEQESVAIQVSDESELPDVLDGYPIKPKRIPEGYRFSYGIIFEHYLEKDVTLIYTNDIHELTVQATIYSVQSVKAADNLEYDDTGAMFMESGVQVTEDYDFVTAILVDGSAYYVVWGTLPKEDIISVITSIRGDG